MVCCVGVVITSTPTPQTVTVSLCPLTEYVIYLSPLVPSAISPSSAHSLSISHSFSLLFFTVYTYNIFDLSEGAIGSGTGILLAVTIIYQYYEMFEKINADPNAFVA